MRTLTFDATPGYPLSGGVVMCSAHDAQRAVARKRVLQLAGVGGGIQGTGVPIAAVDLLTAVTPTSVSASPERSPD